MKGPYKIGTLSRLTGFSPLLLRAWERRFGLLVPDRGDGRQRLYSDDDLAVLTRVRSLVDEGRTIGEIARGGRDALLGGHADDPLVAIEGAHATSKTPGHGQSGARERRKRVVAAAIALDGRALSATLDETFAALTPDRAVADVIEPAAIEIGTLWKAGRCSVASEHLATDQFLHRVGRLLEAAQPPDAAAPRVVAACFPDEDHQLGLLIVAWHLARHGVRVTYLGATLPIEELARACRKSRASAALLSVTRQTVFKRNQRAVATLFESSVGRLFVGGQGVPSGKTGTARLMLFPRGSSLETMIARIVDDVR